MKAAQNKSQQLNIDLLPKEGPATTSGSAIHWILTVGRYLIIITEIVALSTFLLGIYLSKQKNDLKDEIKRQQSVIDQFQDCDKEDLDAFCEDRFRKIQGQIDQVAQIRNTHFENNLVVTELLTLLPSEKLKLETLIIQDDEMEFSGTFETEKELQTLISSINNSRKITALDITNLTKESTFKFTATALINKSSFRTSP